MKRSKFTESQIIFAIRQSETGVRVEEVCRKMGISEATFYNLPSLKIPADKLEEEIWRSGHRRAAAFTTARGRKC